jgi:hypothetical protein
MDTAKILDWVRVCSCGQCRAEAGCRKCMAEFSSTS